MADATARFFDAMAGDYDVLEPWYQHLYARLHAIMREVLAPTAGARGPVALDAGCGTGFQTAVLAAIGYEVHGIDLSAGLLAIARRKRARAVLTRGDLEALPYPDAQFDVAVCGGSVLNLVARPGQALAEIGRVLRPRGRLLLECEHKWSLDLGWALLSSVMGDPLRYQVSPRVAWRQLARPLGEGFRLRYPGYPELRVFTGAELRAMLAAARLVPMRSWAIHGVTNLIPSTVLHRARLPWPLVPLYRGLCALDRAVSGFGPARGVANSLVMLAGKAPA